MKARLTLAALVLASTLCSAHAKEADKGPPIVPPQNPALGALIDSFLDGQPPGMAHRPADHGNVAFKHEWQLPGNPPPGHAHGVTPPIPEPETYALMLAGLGALALVRLRRKDDAGKQ